jgi:FMN phosphatase YigB (HAD superfamily)
MAVTHIYFDWSKTLALPKTRDIFMSPHATVNQRLAVLYPDTLSILDYLCKKGYILGIISNTHKSPTNFVRALSETGLIHYFKGAIALSSDSTLCKKACTKIFKYCLKYDGLLAHPEKAVMIGDDYAKDVIGGLNVGMRAIHVDRDSGNTLPRTKSVRQLKSWIRVSTLTDLLHYF